MSVRIGISPIAWQNDDLPELTAGFTMEQALREARAIGFTGVERGRRMPDDTEGLRRFLAAHDMALCGGWCSGGLLTRDVAAEINAIGAQVAQFAALEAPCLVYAECSNTVQGDRAVPLSARPKLSRDELEDYARKLSEVAEWCGDQGVPLAYHHHMGSMVETEAEIDALMSASSGAVTLLYDTGHLRFGGGDVLAVLDRWGDRIRHVHFKDVRGEVARRAREEDWSFLDAVIGGAFTVPGDPAGAIDFQAVADRLAAMGFDGWIVVEAEQDPAKAPPGEYSRIGFERIVEVCGRAGLDIDGRGSGKDAT